MVVPQRGRIRPVLALGLCNELGGCQVGPQHREQKVIKNKNQESQIFTLMTKLISETKIICSKKKYACKLEMLDV